MISPHATLARYNGLSVLIIQYGKDECIVRYCGHKGRQITKKEFVVKTKELKEF